MIQLTFFKIWTKNKNMQSIHVQWFIDKLLKLYFPYSTAIIYFPFLQPSSLLFNGKCLILHSISFNCKESCSNCNHFFQPYKVEGCTWKYRTALSSNVYPQSLSFLQCILTGSYQPKELLKMDFTTDFSR